MKTSFLPKTNENIVRISALGAFTNYIYKRRGVGSQNFRLFVNHYKVETVNGGGVGTR